MTLAIESGVERDFFRHPRGAGAYEWWYFDGYDPESQYGLVIIFFLGIPFSGVRQASDTPEPQDFPALAFSLYGPEGTEAYGVNLYGREDVRAEGMSIAIGRNTAQRDEAAYHIALDTELLDKRRLQGSVVFSVEGSPAASPAATGDHLWILAAPRCSFQAGLMIGGLPLTLRGTGYHDHNSGTSSLQSRFRRWEWGRAHFERQTVVYYRVTPGGTHRLTIPAGSGGVHFEDAEVREEHPRRNLYGLRYARDFRVGDLLVEQSRLVDNGPFYARFLSRFTRGEETVTGFSEVLRPRALSWRWFWPLLNTRVRPHGSGDVLGRRITHWLIEKGF